jgi:hypothetical protein
MPKIKISRITESVATLMLRFRLKEVPAWAWGWKYRSANEVYQSKDKTRGNRLNVWDGTTIQDGGYAGCLRCIECSRLKPFTLFREDKTYESGYRHICQDCERAQGRQRFRKKIGREPRRYHRVKQETPGYPY